MHETQLHYNQPGVKLFPACGVLNDGMGTLLSNAHSRFFSSGVFKVFRFGLGLHLFPPLEILDHMTLFIDAIVGVHL